MNDCIFCKIAAGEIPSNKVYEDEKCLAFYDLNPMAKVHVLIIPKAHIASAAEVTAENSAVVGHIFSVIPTIAEKLELSDGFRVVTNCGKHAGQSVGHLHFHILGGQQLKMEMC